MKIIVGLLGAIALICLASQAAAWDTGVCGPPPCTHTYIVWEPPPNPQDVGDFHKISCSTGNPGPGICLASGASQCASASGVGGDCSDMRSWFNDNCAGTVSESFYADCEYSSGVYYCADGNGAPDVPVEHTDCYFIDRVTSWSVCSSQTPHWQYATSVHIGVDRDSDTCSNVPLSQWCNTPPTTPLVTVDYGTVSGVPGTTESLNHVIPPVQSSLRCRAEGSVDADGDVLYYDYNWRLNGNPHASTASSRSTSNTIPYPHSGPYDETWRCNVRVFDDWSAVTSNDAIQLINLPPSQPGITIIWPSSSPTPDPFDNLTCSVTRATVDPEGEQVYYRFRWLRNGVAQSGLGGTTGMYPSGSLPVQSYTVPSSLIRSFDNWTCEVTPYDMHDLSGLLASTMVTINSPDSGICDGADNDNDDMIDEGMYSCLNDEFFYISGRKYCFDCTPGADVVELDGNCRGLNDNRALKGALSILEDKESASDIENLSAMYINYVMPYHAGKGLYVMDRCDGMALTLPPADNPQLYVDDAAGELDCSEDYMFFDAQGGSVGGQYKGRLSDGAGPYYGGVVEFSEVCNGLDDDGDGLIDEGIMSTCGSGGFMVPDSKSTYCIDCSGKADLVEANSTAPTGWHLAKLIDGDTQNDVIEIISKYQDTKSLVYGVEPQGLYIEDACSVLRAFDFFVHANLLIYGYDVNTYAFFPDCSGSIRPAMAFTSWQNAYGTPYLHMGHLVDAPTSAMPRYGALYEGGPLNLICGNGVVDRPNSSGVNEQCDIGMGATDNCTTLGPQWHCVSCQCQIAGTYCNDSIRQAQNDAHTYGLTNTGDERCDGSDMGVCLPGDTCLMDFATNRACICSSDDGGVNGICGDGRKDSSETCDTGNSTVPGTGGCAAGYVCHSPAAIYDNDPPKCECFSSNVYNGNFNDGTVFSDNPVYNFHLDFTDQSTTSAASILWTFDFVGDFYGDPNDTYCIKSGATKSENLMNTGTKSVTKGDHTEGTPSDLGDIIIVAKDGGGCFAEVGADSPAPPTHIYGLYGLDTRNLAELCPTCELYDIPAVMNPLGKYSSSPTAAQLELSSAYKAVATLISSCGSCTGTKNEKMQEAMRNRAAAELYLDGCLTNKASLCRLVSYYASTARQLANEGMLVG